MAKVHIIRHGRAAASFTDDMDPGLDELGHEQALKACERLKAFMPLALRTSPLKRAVETSRPLANLLGQEPVIEERFAEIPSPGRSLAERGPWLRSVMQGRWSEQTEDLRQWYAAIGQCLLSITEDTAIFSHFVAINAAVGHALGDDRVTLFRPDNGSITTIETDGTMLTLLSRGDEAVTHVN